MTQVLSRVWFPLALLALVVLGLPGLYLFGAHLFGSESDLNKRLEESYNLGFHIPIPWVAAILLFLVPFLLVLLYFLKLKRKPLQVPSTFLWKKSIEDLH